MLISILRLHFFPLYSAINDSIILGMPQLIVRQVEESVVRKLKARAGRRGVSMEEEHRQILREALVGKSASGLSFKDFLLSMPYAGSDNAFKRSADKGRKVTL